MADNREYMRQYMREYRKNGANNGADIEPGEELTNRPLKHMGRAVEAQLKLVPRETMAGIPALAETLRGLAAVVDHGEPHLHTAALRELRAGLIQLEQIAPAAAPKSRMDELRDKRRAAGL